MITAAMPNVLIFIGSPCHGAGMLVVTTLFPYTVPAKHRQVMQICGAEPDSPPVPPLIRLKVGFVGFGIDDFGDLQAATRGRRKSSPPGPTLVARKLGFAAGSY